MDHWQRFLDSLSTKGGNVFVLWMMVVVLLPVIVYVNLVYDRATASAINGAYGGFSGALLLSLRGESSKQQMTDRRDSILPPDSVAVTVTPPTMPVAPVPEVKP